jgi:Ulp1 family protease
VVKILAYAYHHPHEGATSIASSQVDCDASLFFMDSSIGKIPKQGNRYGCGIHVLGASQIVSSTLFSSWSNNNRIIFSSRGH